MSDYIGREDAVKAIKTALSAVSMIPGLHRVQQWIPVSERLPEDGEYVLVCADKIKSAFGPEDCRFLLRWVSGYSEKRVSAWIPLPEPYKEVE